MQPDAGEQLSLVQGLLSLQVMAVPEQAPLLQESAEVQALLSLQAAVLFVNTQPLVALHVSLVQGLLSLQEVAVPEHAPFLQLSLVVQVLLSLQDAELLANTQPLCGLHESLVQTLLSLHTVVPLPVHVPFVQLSPVVHALPSLHEAPFGE